MRKTNPEKPITPFNKTATFQENIAPIIEDLVKQCTIHNVPMFLTCAVTNNAKDTKYVRQIVSPDTRDLNLTNDEIQKHLCIQLGFDTIYRQEVEFIEDAEAGQKI